MYIKNGENRWQRCVLVPFAGKKMAGKDDRDDSVVSCVPKMVKPKYRQECWVKQVITHISAESWVK